jgi:hypothetical protein
MAKRKRRLNPESEDLMGTVDEYVRSSAAVVDSVYERRDEAAANIAALERVEADLAARGESLTSDAKSRMREEKIRLRELDRKIALYVRTMLSAMAKRVKALEDSPIAKLRASEIRQVKFNLKRIQVSAKKAGSDVRMLIAETMGSIITLENELTPQQLERSGMSGKQRSLANLSEYWKQAAARWRSIRSHAVNHPRFYIPGSEVVHEKRGFGRVLESDGRRVLLRFDHGSDKRATMNEVIPADVAWVDSQFASLNTRIRRGEEITKADLERIVRKMKSIHDVTKPRPRLRTYGEAKRALGTLIGKIQTRLTGDKMDKAEVESLLLELESFQRRISSSDKADWSKPDQRQWATDVSKVRKGLVKLRRKANPCVGFHFHGKDADELLKAIEASAKRQGKPKENPRRNKKSTAKKKASRRSPNSAAALTAKCRKLWDHYCERPSKARLKPVLEHLDKMKSSKAKSVKEERSDCLRVANKEARRLGMK